MERNIVYVYAFDGMADWEIGYLTAELASGRFLKGGAGSFIVRTFSVGREPATTMGGLHLLPDIGIEWVREDDAALLVLPGGDSWLAGVDHSGAVALARRFLAAGLPVAAALYRDAGAGGDRGLITASGLAPLEFAREALAVLGAADERTLEAWYELNRTRSGAWYAALMASLSGAAAA